MVVRRTIRSIWPTEDARLSRWAVRAAAGDRTAFVSLYRALYDPVFGFVFRRVGGRTDAEDVVSAVFHRVLEKLHQFDPDRGSVRTWVLAMARNAAIDHHRRRRASVPSEDLADELADGGLTALDAIERDEQARLVRELLGEQSARVREMFALRYGDGLRYREIAQLMDMSEAAVKQRFSRTLRELRAAASERARAQGSIDYAV